MSKFFLKVAAGACLFAAGYICRAPARPSPSAPAWGGGPEVEVTIPAPGGAAKCHHLRVVRYCPRDGEPVEIYTPATDQLWKISLAGCAVYCDHRRVSTE